MHERDWLTCSDPVRMIRHLKWKQRAHAGRKCRLFAAACCRRVWPLITDDRIRHALEVAERFADGEVDANTKSQATRLASRVSSNNRIISAQKPQPGRGGIPAESAVVAALSSPAEVIWYVGAVAGWVASEIQHAPAWQQAHDAELAALCELVREIIGNPFCPVSPSTAWQTHTVRLLAQAAYDDRILPSGELDPVRLSVLADALEEAGAPGGIPDHLRSPGPHIRGCWPVDLVLGRI